MTNEDLRQLASLNGETFRIPQEIAAKGCGGRFVPLSRSAAVFFSKPCKVKVNHIVEGFNHEISGVSFTNLMVQVGSSGSHVARERPLPVPHLPAFLPSALGKAGRRSLPEKPSGHSE